MKTKFRKFNEKEKESVKTKFTHRVDDGALTVKAPYQPEDFQNVVFLGNNGIVDLFLCWDNGVVSRGLYIGVAGDEFKINNKN